MIEVPLFVSNASSRAGSLAARFGLAAALVLALGCGEDEAPPAPPRPVKAMEVLDASSLSTSVFPGRANPGQEVNLSFRVPGPLVELPVTVGDRVEEGQLVARVDPTDYATLVETTQSELQVAQASATRAQADFQRIQNTFRQDPGATSEMALDRARQLRDSSAATVRAVRSTLSGARDRLSYTSLEAPFAGEVVETYVENFETVLPKQPIVRIVDSSRIEFVVNVPENLIGYAPNVTRVSVTFDALPDVEIAGRISEVGKEATQSTRTYPVTIEIDPPEEVEILSGMAGRATIEGDLPEGARQVGIQIPSTALFTEDDKSVSYVWVIAPETQQLERRSVETGMLTDYGVLIRSGLAAGEQIVVAGVGSLEEGQTVAPIKRAGSSE